MTYRPYTEEDDAYIRSAVAAGWRDGEIGRVLGRSRYSIASRRERIGALRRLPFFRAWTPEDNKRLAELWFKGLTDKEIARQLNRTPEATRYRRSFLKLIAVNGHRPAPRLEPEDESPQDQPYVDAILAEGGFDKARERERARAELSRRGIAA